MAHKPSRRAGLLIIRESFKKNYFMFFFSVFFATLYTVPGHESFHPSSPWFAFLYHFSPPRPPRLRHRPVPYVYLIRTTTILDNNNITFHYVTTFVRRGSWRSVKKKVHYHRVVFPSVLVVHLLDRNRWNIKNARFIFLVTPWYVLRCSHPKRGRSTRPAE